jgi:hypothetical protein
MPVSLPAAPIVRAYAVRGVALWFLARGMMNVLMLLTAGPAAVRHSVESAVGPASVVVLALLLGLADLRMWGQRALLGNLGVSGGTVAVIYVAAGSLGEAGLSLVVSMARRG